MRDRMMRRVELMMFDLDGTLADTGRDLANAVNHTRARFGLARWPEAAIRAQVGLGVEHLLRHTVPEIAAESFAEVLGVFLPWYEDHLLDNTALYPNVRAILQYYRRKRRVVISNKVERLTLAVLRGLGVEEEFDFVLGAGGGLENKPHPAMLLAALERFECGGGRAVMIGDGATDVQAGKRAGVVTCGVTYGLGAKDDLIAAGPDILIDDLIELQKHFSADGG